MLSFKLMSEVKDQLEWIANHNYDSYDSPTSQSNGSIAVYKADVEQLLNKVDWAAKYDEVDTDFLQTELDKFVACSKFNTNPFATVKEFTGHYIVNEIKKWVATSAARRIIR